MAVPKLVSAACEATSSEMEGPYYLSGPQVRYNTGTGLQISGLVRGADTCTPIVGAAIERWHCNPFGIYEDIFRCAMVSDAQGKYQFTTIMPGIYGGLQRHVHFKITAPGYKELITQTYLDNDNPNPIWTFDINLEKA